MINLSTAEDEALVLNIQENKNVEDNLNELINRHSGLCVKMINIYISEKSHPSLNNELIKDKDLHIYQAALKFNPDKRTKFSTHVGNEVKWKCLNVYNKFKRNRVISIEDNLFDYISFSQQNKNKDLDDDVFSEIIAMTNSHPDKRVKKIFYLRYVIGKNNSVMPWKNISSKLGMSIQGCINIHNSAINKFKYKIK